MPTTLKQCLEKAAAEIEVAVGSDSARLDAELLLAEVLNCERTYFYTWPENPLTEDQSKQYNDLLSRRLNGEPIAHILARREFWSLDLEVNNSTLIPRPDTEILVEAVLNLNLPKSSHLLDLGTGTGAIALALATEYPQWSVTAVDVSEDAVALAEVNRERCALNNVAIQQSDWFSSLETDDAFDIIVSNPPYIDAKDPHLREGDVRFEPLTALVADDNGLADIRLITDQSRYYLKPSGWLVVEHGYQQADAVQSIFKEYNYQSIQTQNDYGGNPRVTFGQFNKSQMV